MEQPASCSQIQAENGEEEFYYIDGEEYLDEDGEHIYYQKEEWSTETEYYIVRIWKLLYLHHIFAAWNGSDN